MVDDHLVQEAIAREAESAAARERRRADGPTGRAPSTESRGDPEADDLDSGAQKGAAGGTLAGLALAGPPGAVVGGVGGAAVGALAEGVDEDDDRGFDRTTEGTGPIDPAADPDLANRLHRKEGE